MKLSILLLLLFCQVSLFAANSPYGVCAHLPDEGDIRQEMTAIKNAGIRWIRTDFRWARLQPTKTTWNLDVYAEAVHVADSLGLHIQPILCYDAAWGDTAHIRLDLWTEFVKQVVNHYKNSLRTWEVWNEENGSFWFEHSGPPTAASYAKLLKETYSTIKAIDTSLSVVVGGFAGTAFGYTDSLYAQNTAGSFDVLAYHPYHWPKPPEEQNPDRGLGDDFFDRIVRMKQIMKKYGDETKPFWFTEIGYPSFVYSFRFWSNVVRLSLRKINPGKELWRAAILNDPDYPPCADFRPDIHNFKQALPGANATVSSIDLAALASISTAQFDVLIMPFGETFPVDYYGAIRSFVKTGGTVVFTDGIPMYSGLQKRADGTWATAFARLNTNSYRSGLKFAFDASWLAGSKAPQQTQNLTVANAFSDSIRLISDLTARRFIDSYALAPADTFFLLSAPIYQIIKGLLPHVSS